MKGREREREREKKNFFLFLQDHSLIRVWAHYDSFNLNYLLKTLPPGKAYWGIGLQHMNLKGQNSVHRSKSENVIWEYIPRKKRTNVWKMTSQTYHNLYFCSSNTLFTFLFTQITHLPLYKEWKPKSHPFIVSSLFRASGWWCFSSSIIMSSHTPVTCT